VYDRLRLTGLETADPVRHPHTKRNKAYQYCQASDLIILLELQWEASRHSHNRAIVSLPLAAFAELDACAGD
jgi:hypothetical protein